MTVPPGKRLLIHNLKWAEFESVLEELGEYRYSRIAYYQGTLEIRMPTPEHEVDKELLGDVVKILLDELEIDCEYFGSTTFKGAIVLSQYGEMNQKARVGCTRNYACELEGSDSPG